MLRRYFNKPYSDIAAIVTPHHLGLRLQHGLRSGQFAGDLQRVSVNHAVAEEPVLLVRVAVEPAGGGAPSIGASSMPATLGSQKFS